MEAQPIFNTSSAGAVAADDLLTPEDAARIIGATPRYLQRARYRGDGPAFIRLSHSVVRYKAGDLFAWLDSRRRTSTSEE